MESTRESPNSHTSVETAVAEIQTLIGDVNLMGGNDFEIPEMHNLIRQLNSGKITPSDAVTSAHAIVNRKTDYH